jgi:hypothetical protein
MLARAATAGQATLEPDDVELEEDLDEDLPAESPDFLSLLPELSLEPEPEPESELEVLSDFLLSDPLADVLAGSSLFWLPRLSVR